MEINLGINITKLANHNLLLEPSDNLDPFNIDSMVERISETLFRSDIKTLFYDLNKVLIIDEVYYSWLCSLSKSCALFGVKLKTINMKSTAAISLASIISELPPFETVMDIK